MKTGMLILLTFLSLSVKAETGSSMSEPPFWMSSYDEFNDLQDAQKKYYLLHLETEINKVPTLKDLSGKELKDASVWYKGWEQIRRKLYTYCQAADAKKTCEQIADVRLKTLDMMSNQSKMNRDGDRDEESKESK